MSFNNNSNFNKKANFTEVKFGENKPVLEVELNELQQIQNEARADIIRDTIPSGFIQLGEIDYDYCLYNENQIKLKTDSVAYVNGHRINIPTGTVINLPKAPKDKIREDLVFLEVWKQEVTNNDTLTEYGGDDQPLVDNSIQDSRYPIETTRRIALKWRIRCVADVNFNAHTEGLRKTGENWEPYQCKGQGGNTSIENITYDDEHYYYGQCGSISNLDIRYRGFRPIDTGLFVCGNGSEKAKKDLKTVDGYCFAIPMFKLTRKPSCGKAVPFEYEKLNPKVDYSKFAKLMQEDKVERVVSESIQGRSLVNLINIPTLLTNTYYSYNANTNILVAPSTDSSPWENVPSSLINIKPNTTYSCIYKLLDDGPVSIEIGETNTTSTITGQLLLRQSYKNKNNRVEVYTFTTPSDCGANVGLKVYDPSGKSPKRLQIMVLEGDWTNKEIPDFFTGLKSLGEEEGNLVTVKNGILDEYTYDVNDGNQKLKSFPSLTHVKSLNTLVPNNIKANLVSGSTTTPITKLGTNLTTTGNETIEFTSIKGRTLQNLVNFYRKTYTAGGSNISSNITTSLKTETWYTLIVEVTNNTLNAPIKFSGYHFFGSSGGAFSSESSVKGDLEIFQPNQVGVWRNKIKISTLGTTTPLFTLFSDTATEGSCKASALLLEGDYTNVPLEELPYIEGIKSIGEQENNTVNLTSHGKNLFSPIDIIEGKALAQHDSLYDEKNMFTSSYIPVIPGSTLALTKVSWGWFIDRHRYKIANFGNSNDIKKTITIPDNCYYIRVSCGLASKDMVQIEYGDTPTSYEPYTEYQQNIHLKEPLRSLPNGVCDEIVGNKIIRRVKKVVLDGSENWMYQAQNSTRTNTLIFTGNLPSLPKTSYNANFNNVVSDKFSCQQVWSLDLEGIYTDETIVGIAINKNTLTTPNLEGFKAWLKSNPVTMYYELQVPEEEYLANVYDKESIKTYQLDAPLRSLPNGVKDEIKNGVLIRRCGEYVIKGSDDERWSYFNNDRHGVDTYYAQTTIINNCKANSYLVTDRLKYSGMDLWNMTPSTDIEGISCHPRDAIIQVRLLKSRLSEGTLTAFKNFFKQNPLKVIFQLDSPIEIPLGEVTPQTTDFSLQRQFGEGNYLRELPNGVKDTIEKGKVIRRTTKLTLKGSESWEAHSNNTKDGGTLYRYFLPLINTTSAIGTKQDILICDKLKVVTDYTQEIWSCENIHYRIDSKKAGLYITRNNVTTLQDFKGWLTNNPVSIITLSATPTEEELTKENCSYFPVHDFNTYCGSMYVGEGRNYAHTNNGIPSVDPIVIDTEFRQIDGNSKVEDCNYKKNEEGYDTAYTTSKTKNLIDYKQVTLSKGDVTGTLIEDGVKVKCNMAQVYSFLPINIGFLKPNTKYSLSFKANKIKGEVFVALKYEGNSIAVETNKPIVFTTPNAEVSNYRLQLYCSTDNATVGEVDYTKILLVESGTIDNDYVPYERTIKYFENTEENDIEDLRHLVSLTGFNYNNVLNESFDKLLRGEL